MAEIKVERPLTELLQEVREAMSKADLKKSGYNSHLGFPYFELKDFVPLATKLFAERGMCPIFQIGYDSSGIEYASVNLVKGAESIIFKIPTAEANNSQNPIMNQGSKITYMRRYLYMCLLDLVDNDSVDADAPSDRPVEEKKATDKQVDMIRSLYDEENIAKIVEYYKINDLSELNIKQASEVIARKKK